MNLIQAMTYDLIQWGLSRYNWTHCGRSIPWRDPSLKKVSEHLCEKAPLVFISEACTLIFCFQLGCISSLNVVYLIYQLTLEMLWFYCGWERENPSFENLHYSNISLGHIKKKEKNVLVQTWNRNKRGNPWQDRKEEPDIYLGLYNWANS